MGFGEDTGIGSVISINGGTNLTVPSSTGWYTISLASNEITAEKELGIETIKRKEDTMNYSTAVFLINPDVRAIRVTYEKDTDSKKAIDYLYKTLDKNIKVGDYVVVPTTTRHGMTVCKVSAVDVEIDFDSTVQVKWAVCRVENSQYLEVIAWEDDAASKIRATQAHKKRADLKKTLEDSINGALDEIKALPIATATAE